MKVRIKRPGKRLSEERLAEVEGRFGFRFPPTYRAFLLEHNGGEPEPSAFARKGRAETSDVCKVFLGIDTGRTYDDMVEALENLKDEDEPRVPRRMVPIADDPFGNVICISVSGKDAGKIYFWNHESELMQERRKSGDVDDKAVSLVADSFEAFMGQFGNNDEDEEDDDEEGGEPTGRKAGAKEGGKTASGRKGAAAAKAGGKKKAGASWVKLIKAGDVEAVRAWLDGGGAADAMDPKHGTPVMVAVDEENAEILGMLLERGADASAALAAAAESDAWDLVRLVLDRTGGKGLRIDDWTFQAALGSCTDAGLIGRMIDAGAPLHAPMQRGNALYHATEIRTDAGVVRLLLERGVKVGQFGHMGRTALSNAICLGNLEVCKLLIDAGEQLYVQPPHKKTWMEKMLDKDEKKPKPNWDFINWQRSIAEHNRPKPPAWYLENVKEAKKIAKQVIQYAASKGQVGPGST